MPLTGLEAPMPSFPFTDLHHDLKQPPPRVLHQFVMVLVARFHMSVAEIVMAYALVRPHAAQPPHQTTRRTTTPPPAARTPHLKTSLHAMVRPSKHDFSIQTWYVATPSARSSWGAAYLRVR